MNKFFKLFDIYGGEFNLRINGQTKFRSVTGGFFSFITMAIFIWTVISFGKDFYQRKNPKITMQDGFFNENDKTTQDTVVTRVLLCNDVEYQSYKMVMSMTRVFNDKGTTKTEQRYDKK